MISKAFKRLKRSRVNELTRLQHSLGFKSGKHKRTRLVMAVGKKLAKRTILDSVTHAQHQDKLFTRFWKAWKGLPEQQARERLRFVTILHTVCAVETKAILHAVEQMEEQLRNAFSQAIKQIGILGVTEVEIVNLGLYGEKDTEDEMRKGQVLRELAQAAGLQTTGKEHLALVHFHGIVDVGPNAAITEKQLQKVLRQTWQGSWCVELKCLFTEFSKRKNLSNLAKYVTKGGNEDLRYQTQFGKRPLEAEELEWALSIEKSLRGMTKDEQKKLVMMPPAALELTMAKQGYAKSGEYDDHLGLSVGEVAVQVHVYDALMRRNSARDGYLFLGGTVVRSRYQSRHGFRIWKSALGKTPFWKSTVATSVRRIG